MALKHAAFVLVFLIPSALHHTAFGQQLKHIPSSVAQSLKKAGIPSSHLGIFVQEVNGATPLLSINAAKSMNPASTMKLVTTYAALELLGPTYIWKTEIYIDGLMRNDVLEGELILKGYGDPKLSLESFWLMLRQLRQRGLREIRGDLVLDTTYFEDKEYDPSKFDNEPFRAYNVSPYALLVNFKTVRFQFIPDFIQNSVSIITDPKPEQLQVINGLRLGDGACVDLREKIKVDFKVENAKVTATINGVLPKSCGEQLWYASVLDHPQYIDTIFRQIWHELGGVFLGKTRPGLLPLNAKFFMAHESSDALAGVVRDINKFSNNVMARQVFLTMAAKLANPPGQVDKGIQIIHGWLKQKRLRFPELKIENGSGLSRHEYITAGHMGALLIKAFRSPVMPEFIASLPIIANDGTMRKRLVDKRVAGNGHIKTGTLDGIKTMAGYVFSRTGKRYVVVFFINHHNAVNGEAAQDALLQWVYER